MRRTEMLKAREILRLKYQIGLSLRDIAKSVSCGAVAWSPSQIWNIYSMR